jgi:hypothetical protein
VATAKEKVLALLPMATARRLDDENPARARWVIRPHGETLEQIGEAAHRESWAWADAWRNIQPWQKAEDVGEDRP